jgi:hypothetical protein
MGDEQDTPPAYLAGTSPEFQAAADVVLHVHDGAQLPAHRLLLASTSSILSNVLEAGASQVAAGSKIVLPLDDFTKCEVVDIMKVRVP